MTPYAYHLYHIPTKRHYYGIRVSKDSHPSELWVTYFSSSKIVRILREQYGNDSFEYEVRKIFTSAVEAIEWETRFLSRINAAGRTDWINRHNGGKRFSTAGNAAWNVGLPHSEETKRKISEKRKQYVGKKHHMFGKRHTEFSKQLMSRNRIKLCGTENHFYGKTHSEETKLKISMKNKGNPSPRKNVVLSEKQKKLQSQTMKNLPPIECPHCGKIGKPSGMKRYHFDNCKLKRESI